MPLTLIHPTSNWTHWDALRRHPSRAASSASSQANAIFCRSLLTVLLQLSMADPRPRSPPKLNQVSVFCSTNTEISYDIKVFATYKQTYDFAKLWIFYALTPGEQSF